MKTRLNLNRATFYGGIQDTHNDKENIENDVNDQVIEKQNNLDCNALANRQCILRRIKVSGNLTNLRNEENINNDAKE